ncbi:MAG: hypothetical protein WBE20_08160 [Candidatus Acidiferrales bacterium]
MNWLLKKLGYHHREYRGADFSVRIEPIMREAVSIIHKRQGSTLNLSAERAGGKREGIAVQIPNQIDAQRVRQIVSDLETAFQVLDCDYVISRSVGVDIVPEAERRTAIAELEDMGLETEVSPGGSQIRLKRREGASHFDFETIRKRTPRMMSLMQAVRGKRERFEILAKSKDLQSRS